MRRVFNWPLVLVLSLKRHTLRMALRIAKEQTEDAKALFCKNCSPNTEGCQRPTQCRVQRLKDRETFFADEMDNLQQHIASLTSA